MGTRNPEIYGAFGRLDRRLSALFRMPAKQTEPEVTTETKLMPRGPVARTARIADPTCHDFGELHRD